MLKKLQPSKLPASDAQQATREGLLTEITELVDHLADKKVLDGLTGAFATRDATRQCGPRSPTERRCLPFGSLCIHAVGCACSCCLCVSLHHRVLPCP